MRTIVGLGWNEEPDVDEDYVREIEDAICAGEELESAVSQRTDRYATPLWWIGRTAFIDPRTGKRRIAVELRRDSRIGRWDFASRAESVEKYDEEIRLLGV